MHLIPKGWQHLFSFEYSLPQLQWWNSKEPLPNLGPIAMKMKQLNCQHFNVKQGVFFYHAFTKLIFLQQRSYL